MYVYWPGRRRNFRCGMDKSCFQNQPDIKQKPVRPKLVSETYDAARGKLFMKSTSLGSLVIPDNTGTGTVYHIASANIRTAGFHRFYIMLSFSCNLITVNAKINLSFQIFKRENSQLEPVPISCNYEFRRDNKSNESNVFSFTACDCDSFQSERCNYSVYAKVAGMAASGATSVANSVLSVTLVEIPPGN